MKLSRRVRGVLRTACTWAIAWLPIGIAMTAWWYVSMRSRVAFRLPPFQIVVGLASWSITGAISGAMFATVLTLADRRRTLEELSWPRVALWGAVGGLTFPVVWSALSLLLFSVPTRQVVVVVLTSGLMSCGLGAASAATSLLLARRASLALGPSSEEAFVELGRPAPTAG